MKQNNPIANIFRSASLRLTAWYLIILMGLSMFFSIAIYQLAINDIDSKVQNFQTGLEKSIDNQTGQKSVIPKLIQASEELKTPGRLIVELAYLNLVIFIFGGLVSFLLAKRNLQPIQTAHEAQSRFTSDASHELRTPLAVMKTELEVALNDKSASVIELKKVLSSNLEEVNKLSKLSEMLLNLSKLENAKLNRELFDIVKLTKLIISEFKQPPKRFKIKSDKQLKICGNETAIRDLIRVLVENAIQYSTDKSTINIDITRKNDHMIFNITNTGPGIEKNKLPHIFERFYRGDTSRTNGKNVGYGLGLALAKNITTLHKGDLTVESKPNKYTTFTLSLPLKPGDN